MNVYNFAKKTNKDVKPKKYIYKKNTVRMMPDSSININKLKLMLKKIHK